MTWPRKSKNQESRTENDSLSLQCHHESSQCLYGMKRSFIENVCYELKKKYHYLLCRTNGKIVIATSHIIPADFLSHQRLKIFVTNACNLPKCCLVEAINGKNTCNELYKRSQWQQYSIRHGIVYDFCLFFLKRCISVTIFLNYKSGKKNIYEKWDADSFLKSLDAHQLKKESPQYFHYDFWCICHQFVSTYRYWPPPKILKKIILELVPSFRVRSTNRVVNSP